MNDRSDVSLGSRRTTQGVVLVDHACGACTACAAGAGLWCLTPTPEGRDLTPALPADRVDAVVHALLAVAALVATPTGATALLLADPESPVAVLARALAGGRLVVTDDPAEARTALADEPTGRAAVVVAGDDARAAVRAVRRGGHVCLVDPVAVPPSVTEVVQREVTLVGPRDVTAVAARIDTELWAAVTAA
ncbi:MAG TPA: hypothetical protein VFT70_13320 [Nocardioides sp.]|nr:hypothetical protein [Nocardioides sp.]